MGSAANRIIVVGGGVGGLVAAALAAGRGAEVVLLERAATVGGKMREVGLEGRRIDGGPTVLTMRWVFDAIFAELGERLDDHVRLSPAGLLARHAFPGGSRLDLFADLEQSVDAIAAFAGRREAEGYRRFAAHGRRLYEIVRDPFLRAERPGFDLPLRVARESGLGAALQIDGFRSMWKAICSHFDDPRLRQLFGRYATYSGSSPFLAPATLNVIAHVERDGVWLVEGGMYRLAEALAKLVIRAGGVICCGAQVDEILIEGGRATGVRLAGGERIDARAVIMNGDAEALARGLLGPSAARAGTKPGARSLSAITWAVAAETEGFPLARHNVFFSSDYAAEFAELFERGRVPGDPTVYVCAQDRDDAGGLARASAGAERLLILVNAPAHGDAKALSPSEITGCETRCHASLLRSGLRLRPDGPAVVTTPSDFERLFPGTGGALYGPASHGWASAFLRASSRTRVPGLFLAGGSAHPGAGVPMVALSGRLAASRALEGLASTSRSRRAATPGGTSTSSGTTGAAR